MVMMLRGHTWGTRPHRQLGPREPCWQLGGCVPDRAEANMVFQLVSRRYERGSMIITSNMSFTKWGGVLGDKVLATAILDRLLHYAKVVSLRGDSSRLKDHLTLVLGGDKLR